MPTYSFEADPSTKYELPEEFAKAYNESAETYRQNPNQGEMIFRYLWDLTYILKVEASVKEATSFEMFKQILREVLPSGKQYCDGDILGSTLIEN